MLHYIVCRKNYYWVATILQAFWSDSLYYNYIAYLNVLIRSCIPPLTGPPVLECTDPPAYIQGNWQVDIGCDVCIEPGETVNTVVILCNPQTVADCYMFAPNLKNVETIHDTTGTITTIKTPKGILLILSPVSNPDTNPLGIDLLGTWTCICRNSEGAGAWALTRLGSCSEPQPSKPPQDWYKFI